MQPYVCPTALLLILIYFLRTNQSDMVLFAGNLFHDNNPSRMKIFKRYMSRDNFLEGIANFLQGHDGVGECHNVSGFLILRWSLIFFEKWEHN